MRDQAVVETSNGKARTNLVQRFVGGLQRWQNLISAMIALAAAAWAWQYTQRQIEVAREQLTVTTIQAQSAQRQLALMELDQRPYIWPTHKDPPTFRTDLKEGPRIFWNWEYKNIGKSPATDVEQESFLKVGNGPFRRNGMFVVGRPGLIAAGTDLWTTAWSQPGYTQRDFDRWARIDDGIQMLVKVRYSDGGRNQYEVTRCFGFADNGNVHIKDYKQCEAQVQP